MIYGVQRKVLYVWVAWCLVAFAKAQMGEEPVRKAERVEEEVRSAEAVEETVRRADLAEKPKSESALGRLFSNTPKVKIESPQDGQVMPWETVDLRL